MSEKARVLSAAVESHVRALSDTLGRQANNFDTSMLQGIDAVRRTSDSVTRQSLKAIEGLSSQADLLKNVSENLLQQVSTVTNKFDNQGRFIVDAASALESANTRIDTTLQKRHGELNDTLLRLAGKADQLDQVMRGYSETVEGTLADAEARARHLIQQLAQGTLAHAQAAGAEVERLRSQTDAHSQAVVSAFERMREQTDAQAMRAIEDMRAKVSGVSQEVSQHLGSLTNRFNETSDDLRSQAVRATANLQAEHERLRAEAQRLPAATRESTDTMRAALNDQLRAFSETSNDLRSQAARSAATMQAEHERVRAEAERLPIATRESADAMRSALNEQLRALEQLSSLSARERRDVSPPGPPPATAPPALTHQAMPPRWARRRRLRRCRPRIGGERWSLGDLLARASRDDDGIARAPVLDLQGIAGALDPTTASAIWSRFRAGQRGIMVRSIYTAEGRTSFDEVTERYGRDADFRRTVDRFLADFERLVRDIEQQSPRSVHDHLVSDAGRVYLFLAHASGRLR